MSEGAETVAAERPVEPVPAPDAPPVAPLDPTRAAAYLARRLDPQLAWFEKKAAEAKTWHFGFSTVQVTAMGLIPVVNLLPYGAISSTLLAAFAGIAASIAALGGHHSHWLRYRATATA